MLELTGKCCNGIKAVEFFESLPDVISEDAKTKEFCEEFEAALNRFRYEVAKGIGARKKKIQAMSKGYKDMLYCGNCGFTADEPAWDYCPKCGTVYKK